MKRHHTNARNPHRPVSRCLAALFAAVTLVPGGALAVGSPDPPDLTRGETKGIDLKHGTYNLGSTGLRGWLESITVPAPADTMFRDAIRMGAFKALAKHHYEEGIAAGVIYAKTQGGHGSQDRTGLIMKELVSYGSAAREAIPGLQELIVQFNEAVERREFPGGKLNEKRVGDVEAAIKAIETATTQPGLRKIAR